MTVSGFEASRELIRRRNSLTSLMLRVKNCFSCRQLHPREARASTMQRTVAFLSAGPDSLAGSTIPNNGGFYEEQGCWRCVSVSVSARAVAERRQTPMRCIRWNENAAKAAKAACLHISGNGLVESRMYAMMHAAIHDAVNAIDRRSRPYAFDAEVSGPASMDAAVAAAARDVLVSVIATLPESPECIDDRDRRRQRLICCRARGDTGWPGQDERRGAGAGRRSRDCRAAGR